MAKAERGSRKTVQCYSLARSSSGAMGWDDSSTCRSEGGPGTRNSSLAQRPKSMSLQRSEQKGRSGFSFHSTGLPQVGQVIAGNQLNRDRKEISACEWPPGVAN